MESFSDPLWAEIRKEIGEHCMRSKDYRKANENFQSSLQYEPNKLESVFRLTNSQAREANLDSGLQLLNDKSRLGESGADKKLIKQFNFPRRDLPESLQMQFAGMRRQLREE